MNEKIQFKQLVIGPSSINIELNCGSKIEVSFLEIKRINLTIYKFPFWYLFLVSLLFILTFLFFQYLNLDSFYYLPLFIGIGFFINHIAAKKYLVKVSLKNGSFYFKRIPLKLKTENLVLVNKIKEVVFQFKTGN